jgi:hypothetical protein
MNMIPRLLRPILLGICCGLAMVVFVEFIARGPGNAVASNEPPRIRPVAVKQTALPSVDALVGEILERPLFNSSRQLAEEAPADEEITAAPEPAKLPARLAGVSIRPDAREAIFDGEGDKPLVVKQGQEINGWTLASVEADRVVLKNASGIQVMKPANGTVIAHRQVQAMNRKPGSAPKTVNLPAGAKPPAKLGQPQPAAATPPQGKPSQAIPRNGR